jgi:hypothetical protein
MALEKMVPKMITFLRVCRKNYGGGNLSSDIFSTGIYKRAFRALCRIVNNDFLYEKGRRNKKNI